MSLLKFITIHWTGGTNKANEIDKQHYHFIIEGDGNIVEGIHKPEDNINCQDGKYAAHTHRMNTGRIGISAAGMLGFDLLNKKTDFPLRKVQMEKLFNLSAQLCLRYKIPCDKEHLGTHYEIGLEYPDSHNKGKIDITYLPYEPALLPNMIGDYIRNKTQWYILKQLEIKS